MADSNNCNRNYTAPAPTTEMIGVVAKSNRDLPRLPRQERSLTVCSFIIENLTPPYENSPLKKSPIAVKIFEKKSPIAERIPLPPPLR